MLLTVKYGQQDVSQPGQRQPSGRFAPLATAQVQQMQTTPTAGNCKQQNEWKTKRLFLLRIYNNNVYNPYYHESEKKSLSNLVLCTYCSISVTVAVEHY